MGLAKTTACASGNSVAQSIENKGKATMGRRPFATPSLSSAKLLIYQLRRYEDFFLDKLKKIKELPIDTISSTVSLLKFRRNDEG